MFNPFLIRPQPRVRPPPAYGPAGYPGHFARDPPPHITNAPIFWLLVCWEDSPYNDGFMEDDIRALYRTVTDRFGHDAAISRLSTQTPEALIRPDVEDYVQGFIRDPRNTFVFYYTGHGEQVDGRFILGSMVQGSGPCPFRWFDRLAEPAIFETACNTLFILACCFSMLGAEVLYQLTADPRSRRDQRSIELIAACGDDVETPGGFPDRPGGTFTFNLVQALSMVLRGSSDGSTASIHSRLMQRSLDGNRPLIWWSLDRPYIELRPLRGGGPLPPPGPRI